MSDTKVDAVGTDAAATADPGSNGSNGVSNSSTSNGLVTTTGDTNITATRISANSDPKLYTADELEAVRRQEKDKLYKRLETMQETVARLEGEAKQRAEVEEQKQREIEKVAKQQVEDNMSAKELLAKREQEWHAQLQQVQQQVEAERALREQETRFAQLMEYRQQVVAQYSDRVAPELLDLIVGETPEEIAASAEDMATRSERILQQTQEAMQTARQQMPTVRATAPASGDNSGSNRNFTPEEIRGMSMADYAKNRRNLIGGGSTTNRGLFG